MTLCNLEVEFCPPVSHGQKGSALVLRSSTSPSYTYGDHFAEGLESASIGEGQHVNNNIREHLNLDTPLFDGTLLPI